MRRFLRWDWDVIAGIGAAITASVLHLLHIVEAGILLPITLFLLALLLFRDLRREGLDERLVEELKETRAGIEEILRSTKAPDVILIGPAKLRTESRRFAETARGEVVWFNICFLMFETQDVFDLLLRPVIQNPNVTAVRFIADDSERDLWESIILPKITACTEHMKVSVPRWTSLPRTISFILADTHSAGATEALLSFWGEPFMARTTERQVPRYVFRVQAQSDLIARFVELERQHRLMH